MTESNGKAFEKLSRNVEILRMIFDLLEFEEQLKMATVSQHFYYFFRNFICKEKYRKLAVTKNYHFVSSVRNYETSQYIQLSTVGLEYFVNVFAVDVEQLSEYYGAALDCRQMKNLKSLDYNHMKITNNWVEMLAQYCPKLEKLQINGCCNKEYDIIRLGQDIRVSTLMELKMLKHFTLKTATEFIGKSSALQDILTQLRLKLYNIKMALMGPDETDESVNCSLTFSTLEELDIYGSFNSSFKPCNLISYIDYFANLTSLTLRCADSHNGNEIITSIASACKKLEKLSFKFVTFENIETFAIFNALVELSFYWCKGLTYDNLKEILSEMHLEKFSSTYTKYQGLFQYYFVSPTLKSIHIDAFHSFEFRSA